MKSVNGTVARIVIFILTLNVLVCCSTDPAEQFSLLHMKRVVKDLSSDDFMGRKPFTLGEKLTVEYLENELKDIGFEPAFNGSYFQDVPMIQITSAVVGTPVFNTGKERFYLNSPDEIAVNSPYPNEQIKVENSELVFCGFGIVAPEYSWDDFKNTDIKGKIAVVLINDPGLYSKDTALFKGAEMTYYGRWTYKYEQAAKLGAKGILIIHETEGAGYGFNVPRNSSISSKLFIDSKEIETNCKITGWLTEESASTIFEKCGLSVADLRSLALSRSFVPVKTGVNMSIELRNNIVKNSSKNVAGILRGEKRPEESIVITAHWDHFGIGESQKGDSIYNGAVDNGTTMAWALEIGRVLGKMNKRPDRSVILLFPTAEEQGLTGSEYYTRFPALPIESVIACLNNDMMVPRGRMKDVTMIGYGYSTLDSIYRVFAAKQGRYLMADPNSHTGLFFRSDHFPFYKAGVPAIWAYGCYDSREHGKEWALTTWNHFIENIYHTPADNYDENWDWSGIVEDTQLALKVVLWLGDSKNPPPVLN
jgi:Zn-dependent M28 family amino/carboxypeptidase